jgi:hypothetical protein
MGTIELPSWARYQAKQGLGLRQYFPSIKITGVTNNVKLHNVTVDHQNQVVAISGPASNIVLDRNTFTNNTSFGILDDLREPETFSAPTP